MNRLFCFLIILYLSFSLCGCENKLVTNKEKQKVIIHISNDETVNGYRTPPETEGQLPTNIEKDKITIVGGVTDENNSKYYCASKNSKTFHNKNCSFAKKISDENKIYFPSKEDAIDKGYSSCKKCSP